MGIQSAGGFRASCRLPPRPSRGRPTALWVKELAAHPAAATCVAATTTDDGQPWSWVRKSSIGVLSPRLVASVCELRLWNLPTDGPVTMGAKGVLPPSLKPRDCHHA